MRRNDTTLNIVLTGFRATGKTSVGKALAAQLGLAFVDTDSLLEQRLGAGVAEVVARRGWPFFREGERQLLQELSSTTGTVLATGGGAILHQDAWRRLRASAFVVWLDADPGVIGKRIAADPVSATQRPSLTDSVSVQDEIETLLKRRRPLYAAGSDLRLDVADSLPSALAARIVAAMKHLL
jgi:shikimate kinase